MSEVRTSFPFEIEEREHAQIPVRDGTRLSARLWLPTSSTVEPVPAVLEYIPYRKRSLVRTRDEAMHRYFAGSGYASIRVDLRGSGESEGILADEYLPLEQEDAADVIAWIAAQPWCSGAVGMMGKSWGAFNALQVAARRPPALKAVIAVMGTVDRYHEDVHYWGGCLLNDNFWWGSVMHLLNAIPPDPELVGEAWRDMWMERLEGLTFWPESWLRHQHRDDYWKQGSVNEDFSAIACPVYFVGGWLDLYRDSAFELMKGLETPWRVLMGPWGHLYPHDGVPAPRFGFLQDALRWWARWLKGERNGIMGEPPLQVWMQEGVPPSNEAYYGRRSGRWIGDPTWPSPNVAVGRWYLNRGTIHRDAGPQETVSIRSPQSTGRGGSIHSCGFGVPGDAPHDQWIDDIGSMVFESPPLEEPLEILGIASVQLDISSDRTSGLVAVRLSDVGQGGAAMLVSRGVLNLTHRDGHERCEPLEPGRRYSVRVPMHAIAHSFAAGHRLRISVSNAYWPLVWPSPEAAELTVFTGASFLSLPARSVEQEPEWRPALAEAAETAPTSRVVVLQPGGVRHSVTTDPVARRVESRESWDGGQFLPGRRVLFEELGLEAAGTSELIYTIEDHDPLSAEVTVDQTFEMSRGDWRVRLRSRATMTSSESSFHLAADLDADEGGEPVFKRTWVSEIPREGV